MDFVGNSEIQGTLPLPGSSNFFFSTLPNIFLFPSTFPWIDLKKKKCARSFLPRATWYFVVLFFPPHVSLFSTPCIGPASIRTPLSVIGPCPTSGNVRFFFSFTFFFVSPRGMDRERGKKKCSLKICLTASPRYNGPSMVVEFSRGPTAIRFLLRWVLFPFFFPHSSIRTLIY